VTDLLLVSLGTTRGLQVADAAFLEQARAAGADAEAVGVRIGALDRLRRAYPVNDMVEASAASRATAKAVKRMRPRAVVFSTVTASLLAPKLGVPYAVRLDSPTILNRPGTRNAGLHRLEQRSLAGARLILPWSRAAEAALPETGVRSVVLPPPVVPSGAPAWKRERIAVGYAPDPKAKGLEVLCRAWERAAIRDARLAVYGIEPERARRHLARTETPEPRTVEWRGMTSAEDFRGALRHSLAYVTARPAAPTRACRWRASWPPSLRRAASTRPSSRPRSRPRSPSAPRTRTPTASAPPGCSSPTGPRRWSKRSGTRSCRRCWASRPRAARRARTPPRRPPGGGAP
jgi:hypothetical protein